MRGIILSAITLRILQRDDMFACTAAPNPFAHIGLLFDLRVVVFCVKSINQYTDWALRDYLDCKGFGGETENRRLSQSPTRLEKGIGKSAIDVKFRYAGRQVAR